MRCHETLDGRLGCFVVYLATEDVQSPVRRRFSSFLSSMRRGSVSSSIGRECRASCASLNSLASQTSSPTILLSSPPPKGGKHKQKGIAGLLRASRRSSKQSSIIRQNGDIIIIKAGKIVSIRRQPGTPGGIKDSSPLIRRAFSADANGVESVFNSTQLVAGGGGGASNGHAKTGTGVAVDGGVGSDNNNTTLLTKAGSPRPQRRSSYSSMGSDSVFDDSTSNVLPSSDHQGESPLEMISEEKRLLSWHSDIEQVVETSVDLVHTATTDSGKGSRKDLRRTSHASAAAVESTSTDLSSGGGCVDSGSGGGGADSKRHTTDVGIIISIDEDNSILNVAPLTPRTRDHITRSDLFLRDNGDSALVVPRAMTLSKSTQGLCKRSLHRLPSVEHLDPPVRLKRSSSDYNVSKASKTMNLLQPAPTGRRWSFGRNPRKEAEHV